MFCKRDGLNLFQFALITSKYMFADNKWQAGFRGVVP